MEECSKVESVQAKWADYMACADRIEAKGSYCILGGFAIRLRFRWPCFSCGIMHGLELIDRRRRVQWSIL